MNPRSTPDQPQMSPRCPMSPTCLRKLYGGTEGIIQHFKLLLADPTKIRQAGHESCLQCKPNKSADPLWVVACRRRTLPIIYINSTKSSLITVLRGPFSAGCSWVSWSWRLPGDCLGPAWGLHGACMGPAWGLHGISMGPHGLAWGLHGACMDLHGASVGSHGASMGPA